MLHTGWNFLYWQHERVVYEVGRFTLASSASNPFHSRCSITSTQFLYSCRPKQHNRGTDLLAAMHSSTVLISVLTVTPAVSFHYLTWDDQDLIVRNYFDPDEYLYASLQAREWSNKAIQAGKDAIAVNHAEKSAQGHLVFPDKTVEFAGRLEDQFLPHRGSTPMKVNPAPTAEQSK